VWVWLVLGGVLVWIVPAVVLAGQVLEGGLGEGVSLLRGFKMWEEVGWGLIFATCGAAGAMAVLWGGRRWGTRWGLLAMCVPGLTGGLVVGLTLQWAFQRGALASGYDTPVPLVLALVCLLMPPAVLVGGVLLGGKRGSGEFLGERLVAGGVSRQKAVGGRVIWLLRGRGRMALGFILFYWIYFEVLASALLRPTGMTPATVRLYDLTHYGKSGALAAMMIVSSVAPALVGGMMYGAVRVLDLQRMKRSERG
jgi:ABC-type Fe3+ transport system permease subunit